LDLSEVTWTVQKDGHRWKYSWRTGEGPPTEGHALTRSGAFDALWHSIQDAAQKEKREAAERDDHATEYGGSYQDLVKLKEELAPEP
jgi:hypothetical protein